MKLEEIVALSVKHNVSDLHLCNSAAPRWRRQGRLEPAPFPAPDIANLLNDWLDAAQLLHWQEHGQIDFALTLACGARLRASAFAHTRGISILLGELRDSETIRLALTAAETGHLVMATLHTRGAAPAVERLIDVFPAEEKDQVRSQLAGSLCAVLAQKLLPARQGGRVALYELLVNTPAVANLIREGKVHQLPGVMQTGMQAGMLTFTQSFQQRVAAGAL